MLSFIISTYRGSKMFKGTVVLGKIIKLLSGKTASFFGKSSFFIIGVNISYLKLLELKKTSYYNVFLSGHSSVVERLVANEKVEGSTPFARSNYYE
tara:strand:- start:4645 stop:4932 length:288 start_codon:yes stop_codon:yes gene_type:complete